MLRTIVRTIITVIAPIHPITIPMPILPQTNYYPNDDAGQLYFFTSSCSTSLTLNH